MVIWHGVDKSCRDEARISLIGRFADLNNFVL